MCTYPDTCKFTDAFYLQAQRKERKERKENGYVRKRMLTQEYLKRKRLLKVICWNTGYMDIKVLHIIYALCIYLVSKTAGKILRIELPPTPESNSSTPQCQLQKAVALLPQSRLRQAVALLSQSRLRQAVALLPLSRLRQAVALL